MPEDRLTSLHDDLLKSVLSLLPIKQRVALSAVCSRFLRLLSSIPRLDAFHLDVVHSSGGDDISQQFTFPRALIHKCHIVFHDYLSQRLEQLLVEDLIEAGVQDLILENSGERLLMNLSGRENCGFFGVKSLRSLSLHGIILLFRSDGHPYPPMACTLLTSLKLRLLVLHPNDFLRAFLISCPFLETLHFTSHFDYADDLYIHSASIKHLVLLQQNPFIRTIDVCCPNLESLTVSVASELRIEAPKVQNASLLFYLDLPVDPPDALMKILGGAFKIYGAWLMLNSNTTPNGLATEHEIVGRFSPDFKESIVILNFDFDLKDQSSTMILTQFLKKCNNCTTKFDIRVDPIIHIQSTNETALDDHLLHPIMHIQSTNETARDDHLLHGSPRVELIKLRMIMPDDMFEGFLSNQKEMKEELKQMGLQKLKSRTSNEQFNDILASNESLVEVSSSITSCIEIKF